MSVHHLTLTLGALDTNCYLVWDEQSRQAVVIDPADDGGFISEQIVDQQLELQAIVLTHGHFDHVLGLLELKLNFEVPIYLHPDDIFLIKQAQSSALHWLKRSVDPVPLPTDHLREGQHLSLAGTSFQVIHTPGHTPGSVSLYNQENGLLFSGDTLFKSTIGRTDFKYSDPELMRASLRRLSELPPETNVYPGHGQPTTIKSENP